MKRKIKWKHPLYKFACCYNRNGNVYTEINYNSKTIRKSTPYTWHNSNKHASINILEERIKNVLNVNEEKPTLQTEVNTLYKLISLFLEIHVSRLSKSAHYQFKQACTNFLKSDFYLSDSDGIFQHIILNIKQSNLHTNTKHRQLTFLKQMFSFAVDRGYMLRNPVTKEIKPRLQPTKLKIFTIEELNRIINYFQNKNENEFVLLIKFVIITGTRIEESLKVHWKDITENAILIHGKGSRDRQFPRRLFPEIESLLQELKEFEKGNNGKLFHWTTYTTLEKWLREACVHLGFYEPGKSFHSIRKYCENLLINNDDFTPYEVAEIMGHTIMIQESHYKEILGAKRLTDKILLRRENRINVRNLYGTNGDKHT